MATSSPDLTTVRNVQQQTWADGDFDAVAVSMVMVGELLCEAVDMRFGQRVLDVATGSGNTAISAARRGGVVVGTDYVPSLLVRGRERAASERLEIEFVEADADAQPFPNATFDIVLSTFGVMFAPDQHKTAQELLRVTKPGGKIGMANWTPDSTVARFFSTMGKYVPPPAGLDPPLRWGTEPRLRELFDAEISDLQIRHRETILRAPSAAAWLDHFRNVFGPLIRTFAALDSNAQAQLSRELIAAAEEDNVASDGTLATPLEYAEVVAVRN